MRNVKFDFKNNGDRILTALDYLGIEKTEKILKYIAIDTNYSELKSIKGLGNFSDQIVSDVKGIVNAENKMNYVFSEKDFEDWVEGYYFPNFYKGKGFGLKGIGLTIYSTPLICEDIVNTFKVIPSNYEYKLNGIKKLDCEKICRNILARESGNGIEALNKETLLGKAVKYSFCIVKNIEADSWIAEKRDWIKEFLHYTEYNKCCLIVPLTRREYPVDRVALSRTLAYNIDVTIKE